MLHVTWKKILGTFLASLPFLCSSVRSTPWGRRTCRRGPRRTRASTRPRSCTDRRSGKGAIFLFNNLVPLGIENFTLKTQNMQPKIQDWAKKWAPGCESFAHVIGKQQQEKIPKPGTHFLAHPCSCTNITDDSPRDMGCACGRSCRRSRSRSGRGSSRRCRCRSRLRCTGRRAGTRRC